MLIIGPAVDACAKASVTDCLAGIRQPLMKGAFTGPMDCDSAEIKLKLVGTVRARGMTFAIYDFRYRTKPELSLIAHGGQKVLILGNKSKYLGQYALSPPPFREITVRKNLVEIDVPPEHGNRIAIGFHGPPTTVRLDDDVVRFTK